MGSTFRMGHAFPASAGFTGSTGKQQSIGPYMRKTPQPAQQPMRQMNQMMRMSRMAQAESNPGGSKGLFARSSAPMAGPPKPKPIVVAPPAAINPGSSLQGPKTRQISQQDMQMGGMSPLRPGYKKGGKVHHKARGGLAKSEKC